MHVVRPLKLVSTTSEFMAVSLEDEGEAPRPRMVYVVINSDVVNNKCYIYIPTGMKNACYPTFDTTSYQSQEPNDNLVRMTQPVLSL